MEKNEDAHGLSLYMIDDIAKAFKEGKLKSCEMVVGDPEVYRGPGHSDYTDKITYTFVVDNSKH